MTPSISYVVSAYNRPADLRVCLSSLAAQRGKNHQVIVTDNADSVEMMSQNREIAMSWGARYIWANELTCYHSAEIGAAEATGEYLCFPSDDSYYVSYFEMEMLKAARDNDADLVYCNAVYGRFPHMRYRLWETQPKLDHIDKTFFLLKRELFRGFPNKPDSAVPCACDGYLIDQLVSDGVKVVGIPDVLAVHN